MSAIVAGTACKKCGESFYVSLGHPKWFEDVIRHGKKKCKTYLWFERMQKSGMCTSCFGELEGIKIKEDKEAALEKSKNTPKRTKLKRGPGRPRKKKKSMTE